MEEYEVQGRNGAARAQSHSSIGLGGWFAFCCVTVEWVIIMGGCNCSASPTRTPAASLGT